MRRRRYDEELLKKLKKQEEKGILYEALTKEREEPYFRMVLKRPEETEEDWSLLLSWSDYWRHPVKDGSGKPLWRINEKGKNTKIFGRQTLPVRVFVDRPEDAFALLGMNGEKREFLSSLKEVDEKNGALKDWFIHYYPRIRSEEFYPLFFNIADFFQKQEEKEGYLREISIPGVDTKFLERHAFLVRTLWNALFPDNQVDSNEEMKEKLFVKDVPTPLHLCQKSGCVHALLRRAEILPLQRRCGPFQPAS